MTRTHAAPKSRSIKNLRKRNLTWLWIGLGFLAILAAGLLIFGPKAVPSASQQASLPPITEISAAEAYEKVQDGVFILDVRTQEEWNEFHIQGSTLIPLAELQNRLAELPKDRDILVVCRSGHRSLSAVGILQEAGFSRLASLSGGLQAWVDANYPVER